jgi:predicted DNA-binding protein YlxM (UPF0122 family)
MKNCYLKRRIEKQYGMNMHAVISKLYREFETLSDIAEELDTNRRSIYNWVGSDELAMMKAQARLMKGGAEKEISVGVLT